MLVATPSLSKPNPCNPPRLHPSTLWFPWNLAQDAVAEFIELSVVLLQFNIFVCRFTIVTNHALIQNIYGMLHDPIHARTLDIHFLTGVLLVPDLDRSYLFLNASNSPFGIAIGSRIPRRRVLDRCLGVTSSPCQLAHQIFYCWLTVATKNNSPEIAHLPQIPS
jgi:hypothetical protein